VIDGEALTANGHVCIDNTGRAAVPLAAGLPNTLTDGTTLDYFDTVLLQWRTALVDGTNAAGATTVNLRALPAPLRLDVGDVVSSVVYEQTTVSAVMIGNPSAAQYPDLVDYPVQVSMSYAYGRSAPAGTAVVVGGGVLISSSPITSTQSFLVGRYTGPNPGIWDIDVVVWYQKRVSATVQSAASFLPVYDGRLGAYVAAATASLSAGIGILVNDQDLQWERSGVGIGELRVRVATDGASVNVYTSSVHMFRPLAPLGVPAQTVYVKNRATVDTNGRVTLVLRATRPSTALDNKTVRCLRPTFALGDVGSDVVMSLDSGLTGTLDTARGWQSEPFTVTVAGPSTVVLSVWLTFWTPTPPGTFRAGASIFSVTDSSTLASGSVSPYPTTVSLGTDGKVTRTDVVLRVSAALSSTKVLRARVHGGAGFGNPEKVFVRAVMLTLGTATDVPFIDGSYGSVVHQRANRALRTLDGERVERERTLVDVRNAMGSDALPIEVGQYLVDDATTARYRVLELERDPGTRRLLRLVVDTESRKLSRWTSLVSL
jgi:hypothetical protein